MTSDEFSRMFDVAKRVIDQALSAGGQSQPRPQPDGAPSPLFDALTQALGEGWWKRLPVSGIEEAASLIEVGTGPFGAPLASQLRALADRIELERIGATGTDEPLDDAAKTWAQATDNPDWKKGYDEGLASGLRTPSLRDNITNRAGEQIRVGAKVKRTEGSGYAFPGEVVAVFANTAGVYRVVVESLAPGTEGMLHIFNPNQLKLT